MIDILQIFTVASWAAEKVSISPKVVAIAQSPDIVTMIQNALKGHGAIAWTLALFIPLASKKVRGWIQQKGIGMFCKWWVKKVEAVVAKDHGPVWDAYIDAQIKLHVELAQKLYPQDGLGPQRKALLFSRFPFLISFEPEIEQFIKENGQALDQLSRDMIDRGRTA